MMSVVANQAWRLLYYLDITKVILMSVSRLSLSLTPELAKALRRTAAALELDVSRLVETFLREHPRVQQEVRDLRSASPGTKKGRSVEKLLALAEVAEAQWDARIGSGKVKLRAR